MAKLDTNLVRQAATGRWCDILSSLGGLTPDQLDPKQHQPCPKCGGEDRFRAFDDVAQTGGLFCNKCHDKKNGDGFSSLQWLCGCKFPEALAKVAEFCGVKATNGMPKPKRQGKGDPEAGLVWKDWNSTFAAFFLAAKPEVTEESLIACGARMARYKNQFNVIALPIIGEDLDVTSPVGWCLYNYNAKPLPKWNKEGDIVGQAKCKITYGSQIGLVGRHAIERLQTPGLPEVVWKVEGMTDLLALQAIIPENLRDRHLVVTNSNGAGESPKWRAVLLGCCTCNVIHDADKPGQSGAENWAMQIAAQADETTIVRNIQLPYEVAEEHGKDLRDWIAEGHTYADLMHLADTTLPVTVERTASGEVDLSKAKYPMFEQILRKLQLQVLYETDDHHIRLFSTFLRKSSTIKDLGRLSHERLIQHAGSPAIECISLEPDGENTWGMRTVRQAIGHAASKLRGKQTERGIGIWQGMDDQGRTTDSIIIVGYTEAARWNGDLVLRKITEPHCDGLTLDFGDQSLNWYDFDTLARNLDLAADVDWRRAAMEECVTILQRWRWGNPAIDPHLITGLILASYVQTLWDWRPLVAMNGESNCGKSTLMDLLSGKDDHHGLFSGLAFKSEKSTEAGIRQAIANTAQIALCDEFEQSRDRDKVLEVLRASTRGGVVLRGTSGDQKGQRFSLRHIGWVAATESGLLKQPDMNRFIQFELLTALPGEFGKLRLPPGHLIEELAGKLMAISIRCVLEAKALAKTIKDHQVPGIDARTVESYGVVAAILGVAAGYDEARARTLLEQLLGAVDKSQQGVTDQQELLDAILTSSVFLGPPEGVRTVAQVLESPSLAMTHAPRLEAAGIRVLADGKLFIHPKIVERELLKGDQWRGQRLDQILLRLAGAERTAQKVCGRTLRGVSISTETSDAMALEKLHQLKHSLSRTASQEDDRDF